MAPRRLASLASFACVLATAGCTSSTPSTPNDAGTDAIFVTCQNDPRLDTYTPKLTKASSSGALKATLVLADPAPPARDTNTWTLQLADGSGAPITHAAVTIEPFMPDHGHGTSIVATATPQPDGTYTVTPLYFFMGGVWRVSVSLSVDGGASAADKVSFFFCVAG